MPHCDDAPRLPCLQTGTPAAATTRAVIVETFTECERSPPVPTTSIAVARSSSLSGTNSAAPSTASSIPDSSSAVSPLARSATAKAMIWAGVASPARITPIAVVASTVVRSWRSINRDRTPGQPPSDARSARSRAAISASVTSVTDPESRRRNVAQTLVDCQAGRRRCRTMRRRSRSVAPPHTPAFSLFMSACSRQATRTPQPSQTALACSASSSSSG